jgi:hypothetical protein
MSILKHPHFYFIVSNTTNVYWHHHKKWIFYTMYLKFIRHLKQLLAKPKVKYAILKG